MTVQELIDLLSQYDGSANVRFSVDNESQSNADLRIFCEDGVDECLPAVGEVTLCLTGYENIDTETT